jgi:hypothetical protein
MRRSRLIWTLIFYLALIAVAGPAAFQIGKAAGRALRPEAFPGPFVVAAPPEGALGVSDFFDCDGTIRLPALRQFDRIQDCSLESRGGAGARRAVAPAPRQGRLFARSGPVSRSLIRRLAEGPLAGGSAPGEAPDLVSDAGAMAPGAAPAGPFALAFPGAGFAGPAIPGASRAPSHLVAALDQGADGKPPSFDPPPTSTATPEVPVPPAFLLIATGAAALRLAARRRRSAPPP